MDAYGQPVDYYYGDDDQYEKRIVMENLRLVCVECKAILENLRQEQLTPSMMGSQDTIEAARLVATRVVDIVQASVQSGDMELAHSTKELQSAVVAYVRCVQSAIVSLSDMSIKIVHMCLTDQVTPAVKKIMPYVQNLPEPPQQNYYADPYAPQSQNYYSPPPQHDPYTQYDPYNGNAYTSAYNPYDRSVPHPMQQQTHYGYDEQGPELAVEERAKSVCKQVLGMVMSLKDGHGLDADAFVSSLKDTLEQMRVVVADARERGFPEDAEALAYAATEFARCAKNCFAGEGTIMDATQAAGLISSAVRNYMGLYAESQPSPLQSPTPTPHLTSTSSARNLQSVYNSPSPNVHSTAGRPRASMPAPLITPLPTSQSSPSLSGTMGRGTVGTGASNRAPVMGLFSTLSASSASLKPKSTAPVSRTAEEEAKRKRMRANVIKELMETEVTYYTHLKTLLFSFVEPLKEKKFPATRDPLINTLFSFLPPIANLTKEIVHGLQAKPASGDDAQKEVGKIFMDLAPVLKMYENYLNNYDSAIAKFKELQGESSALDAFVRQFCAETNQQDVTFYFIMPIQRLPRYEMLLKEILKYTNDDHPDHQNLEGGLEKIKHINDFLNDQKREDDNRRKINEIQNNLVTKSNTPIALFQTGRYYLREFPAETRDKKRKKKEEDYYFLFSDLLMRTKPGRNSLFNWKQSIVLKDATLTDIPDNDKAEEYCFEISDKKGDSYALVLSFATSHEKQQQYKAIEQALVTLEQGPAARPRRDLNIRGTIAIPQRGEKSANTMSLDELVASLDAVK